MNKLRIRLTCRFTALLLALSIGLPCPAAALRPLNAGMEEGSRTTSELESRLKQPASKTAGMEEESYRFVPLETLPALQEKMPPGRREEYEGRLVVEETPQGTQPARRYLVKTRHRVRRPAEAIGWRMKNDPLREYVAFRVAREFGCNVAEVKIPSRRAAGELAREIQEREGRKVKPEDVYLVRPTMEYSLEDPEVLQKDPKKAFARSLACVSLWFREFDFHEGNTGPLRTGEAGMMMFDHGEAFHPKMREPSQFAEWFILNHFQAIHDHLWLLRKTGNLPRAVSRVNIQRLTDPAGFSSRIDLEELGRVLLEIRDGGARRASLVEQICGEFSGNPGAVRQIRKFDKFLGSLQETIVADAGTLFKAVYDGDIRERSPIFTVELAPGAIPIPRQQMEEFLASLSTGMEEGEPLARVDLPAVPFRANLRGFYDRIRADTLVPALEPVLTPEGHTRFISAPAFRAPVVEAIYNACLHGEGGTLEVFGREDGSLRVVITDSGGGMEDPNFYLRGSLDTHRVALQVLSEGEHPSSGLGWGNMALHADGVTVETRGKHWELVKAIPSPDSLGRQDLLRFFGADHHFVDQGPSPVGNGTRVTLVFNNMLPPKPPAAGLEEGVKLLRRALSEVVNVTPEQANALMTVRGLDSAAVRRILGSSLPRSARAARISRVLEIVGEAREAWRRHVIRQLKLRLFGIHTPAKAAEAGRLARMILQQHPEATAFMPQDLPAAIDRRVFALLDMKPGEKLFEVGAGDDGGVALIAALMGLDVVVAEYGGTFDVDLAALAREMREIGSPLAGQLETRAAREPVAPLSMLQKLEEAIAPFREMVDTMGGSIRVEAGDFTDPAFQVRLLAQGPFDHVVCTNVINPTGGGAARSSLVSTQHEEAKIQAILSGLVQAARSAKNLYVSFAVVPEEEGDARVRVGELLQTLEGDLQDNGLDASRFERVPNPVSQGVVSGRIYQFSPPAPAGRGPAAGMEELKPEEFAPRFPQARWPEGARRVYLAEPETASRVRFYSAHETLWDHLRQWLEREKAKLPEGMEAYLLRLPAGAADLEAPGAIIKDWMLRKELPYAQQILPELETALGEEMPSLPTMILFALKGAGGQVEAVIGVMTLQDAEGNTLFAYFV